MNYIAKYEGKLNMKILIKFILLITIYACATKTPQRVETSQNETIDSPTISELLIIDKTNDDRMKRLVGAANCVINKKSFQNELKLVESFTNIQDNGKQVLEKLLKSKQGNVYFYTQNWFSYKVAVVNGYVNAGSDRININTRTFNRIDKSVLNTIVHEQTHVAGYSHQGNSPKGNAESVPYMVGTIAENNTEGCL